MEGLIGRGEKRVRCEHVFINECWLCGLMRQYIYRMIIF